MSLRMITLTDFTPRYLTLSDVIMDDDHHTE
jgi:hypothetical protein